MSREDAWEIDESRERTKEQKHLSEIAAVAKDTTHSLVEKITRVLAVESEPLNVTEVVDSKLEALRTLVERSVGVNLVIYDKREEESRRPEMLKAAFKAWEMDCKFMDVVLPIGDYIVNGVCVEYKTAEDFIQSKISKHLDKQLFDMSARYSISYLFVEGDVFAQAEFRVHENAILSSLIGASFKQSSIGRHGMVNLIPLRSKDLFPLAIKFLMAKEHVRELPALKVSVSKKELMVATLSTLPRVDTVRAKLLLDRFGSLKAVSSATVDDLMTILGIGPKIANGIYEYFNEVSQ